MSAQPKLVVIGASAGGLAALKQIVAGLPDDFPAAVLVTMHIGNHESILPRILSSYSALPVRHAADREPITPGTILIAPSDHHLLVEPGHAVLSHGPKENFSRPAIDPLFRTAAAAYRTAAIGVVLTGNLDDGTVGLQAIKAYGGVAIVQDPEEAEAPSMPLSAIRHVDIDLCLTLDGIVDALVKLAGQPVEPTQEAAVSDLIRAESQFMSNEDEGMDGLNKIAQPSPFTCPECHGSLWEVAGATPQRFRCHTGHAFTAQSLAAVQEQVVEEAIWAAVRALHEKESLLKRFEKKARDDKRLEAAAAHAAAADQVRQHAHALRRMASG
jgi:two-component system chemotaxis response regulator CheB